MFKRKIYLLLVVFLITYAGVCESRESKISVLQMIEEWFLHPGLHPIIDVKKPVKLEECVLVDTNMGPCVQVLFSQKGVTYNALLMLHESFSEEYSLFMLYFSPNNLEHTPDPQLFYDVLGASCSLLKEDLKKNYSVFIEQANVPKKDKKNSSQIWTFFNSTEKKQVLVHLKPCDKGGTDYAVVLK